ncbi:Amyloid-beta A4 precursor protein-binding family B member 3 [Dissostichus eleginoides]|uniref:Amyloid-beta A4 protein-binding family B member 3 n=1 Tax=Dissostichus eleginoides TaxID=100907 RepID=A0AAD9B1W3_DISEL|nr:Amyloid-beta A4 precursor protein-binding family B member 3 [Dissostichus eleginoides]
MLDPELPPGWRTIRDSAGLSPSVCVCVCGCVCGVFRDFAFVAGDKDSCVLKCHVFRCDSPARTIASALHEMCSKMMSDQTLMRPSRSLTMDNISPEDLPRQVEFLEAVRQQEQKFDVQYIGNLPVSRAMGMEVLNRAIESILNATDREEWEPAVIHVTDHILSLWRGEVTVVLLSDWLLQEGEEPLWECQVRLLTFLGVGHDCHTFAVICDGGAQRFEAHVFWSEPDAGQLSEAVQAACMVLSVQCSIRGVWWRRPPPEDEVVERDPKGQEEELPPPPPPLPPLLPSLSRKGMKAFLQTFRKQAASS